MPVVFGPTCGPRQGPDGELYDYADAPRTTVTMSFLTQASALEAYLPPFCVLDGEPVVTVEHIELRDLEWLAGRTYSLLGVKYPVRYAGPSESVRGPFYAVLWENRPEPILSGREELGFAKLYCELPAPRVLRGRRQWAAVWDGHTFIELSVDNLRDAVPPAANPAIDGVIHHRYLPRVSATSEAEIEQMVLTPAGGATVRYESYQRGDAEVRFLPSTWEQLPTMFHIVNALAALPVLESRGASIAVTRGGKDLSDQRVLG
ncbi:acetoacetate decarboxylase family protein [Brevundimonas sp. NIBR10]|uniref:acetoacetate decarboxylase family protein n=1 Tax=Brevundimonas sp. NIBR10 TaxID=3015997 RepID=UPI0022F1B90A|nr:acetoacetate decarboxylase family protein [Brevundimonas sp. NIBR10]